jgi:hypothetical protein
MKASVNRSLKLCQGEHSSDFPIFSPTEIETSPKFHYKKNPYIPLTKTPEIYNYGPPGYVQIKSIKDFKPLEAKQLEKLEISEVKKTNETPVVSFIRRRRSEAGENVNQTETVVNQTASSSNTSDGQWKAIKPQNVIIYSKDDQIVLPSVPQAIKVDEIKIIHEKPQAITDIPHFHVTYWMFYPFSQGKTVCTLNLGPLGPIPIPLVPIFNFCLGTKKEFGSHVGDWEHMSLFFRGRMEPDVSID